MPITQDRMLTVLREAQALRSSHEELRAELSRLVESAAMPVLVLEGIRQVLGAGKVPDCPSILLETNHFERVAKRNEKSARVMEKRRREGKA